MSHSTSVTVTFHADWEIRQLLDLLKQRHPGTNWEEMDHIQTHLAKALDPIHWERYCNNPFAAY